MKIIVRKRPKKRFRKLQNHKYSLNRKTIMNQKKDKPMTFKKAMKLIAKGYMKLGTVITAVNKLPETIELIIMMLEKF